MKREKFLCHFIHEGKPSPVIFISFSLTFSSHKRTGIKFVDFMAFLAFMMEDGASPVAHLVKSLPAMHDEVGMRWEKLKLGDANQIRLNHTIMSAYFLKFCEHNKPIYFC